jgi:hypothetical protein
MVSLTLMIFLVHLATLHSEMEMGGTQTPFQACDSAV